MSTVTSLGATATSLAPLPNRLNPRPPTHVVQFYKDDEFLLNALSRFIGTAIGAGEAAVVIATYAHREALELRLAARGLDMAVIREDGRYIFLDAVETLSSLMVDGRPDAARFFDIIGGHLERAAPRADDKGAEVSVFGEMVALLWARGPGDAAIELEKLWNQLAERRSFHLCCAYPLAEFYRKEDAEPFLKICEEHSGVIPDESYSALLTDEERLRSIANWQQKAQALEHERALRQSEDRFRVLVESIKDYAIFMLDPDGRVSSWNAGAERIKGYKASEIMGRHFSIFYPIEDVDEDKPGLGLKTAIAEGHFEAEGWRIRKDSSRFWASVTITALRDEFGNLKGFAKVTRDVTERKRSEESLRDLSGRLLSLQDAERRRMARELHDSTAQTLSALSLNLALVNRYAELTLHPQASKALAESLTLTDQALQEIRTFSYLLHPPLLDEAGLADALRWYIDGFAHRTNIEIDFKVLHELGRLPRDVETALFRIIQECLTNVYRHSASSTAGVRLDKNSVGISLVVWDKGKGVPEEILQRQNSSHAVVGVGLRGMGERARQLGGHLTVRAAQPGTIIEVSLPVPGQRQDLAL